MSDNGPPETRLPDGVQLHPDFGDWPQMLNMRDWLKKLSRRPERG